MVCIRKINHLDFRQVTMGNEVQMTQILYACLHIMCSRTMCSLSHSLSLMHTNPSVHTGTFTDLHTHTQMLVYVFGQSVVSVCLCLVLYVMYNAHETVCILI